MSRNFNILQIGGEDLEPIFQDKKNVYIDYLDPILFTFESGYLEAIENLIEEVGSFNLVFIQTTYSQELLEVIELVGEPYTIYVDEKYWDSQFENNLLLKHKFIKPLYYKSIDELHYKLKAGAFTKQYGDKVSPIKGEVHPKFQGEFEYLGNKELILSGDFGKSYIPIVSWNQNLVYDKNMMVQLWPEFFIEGNVDIQFVIRLIPFGSLEHTKDVITLTMKDLKQPVELMPRPYDANISIVVKAKGSGVVHLRAIHKRWSRAEMGQFIMGGQRYNDEHGEEFIHYFNPGDLKPPLNVYFSGYRSAEGFEGYYMMKNLKAPFLLIGDPRIEGGSFYLGSEAYENSIKNIIKDTLEYLNFKDDDLILSGLSMGSFGALYYGAQLNPRAVIIGKPLVNIGRIAENMKLKRPNDFGTVLDILMAQEDTFDKKNINNLNKRFWKKFKTNEVENTTFAIAYMENDDYDDIAFDDLMFVLRNAKTHVMTRGIPGRHNDDSATITSWFVNFYHIILNNQFGRE